jgi:hypothetical protein
MSTVALENDVLKLPAEIARKLKGKRIELVEVEEGVLLRTVGNPIAEARGMLKGSRFTSERYLSLKRAEKEKER